MKYVVALAVMAMMVGCVQPQPTEQSSAPQNPVITSVTANPSTVQVGQSSVVTCDAYDPQGKSLSYNWRADLGDFVGHGSTVQYSAAYCCVGANRITVTVKNTSGGSATGFVDVGVRP